MDKSASARPVRRHLTQPRTVTLPFERPNASPVGHHAAHGNGVRVHAIYFAAVSLAALLLVLGAAIATTAR